MITPTPMLLATVGLLLIGEVAGSSSCEDCKFHHGKHLYYLKCENCQGMDFCPSCNGKPLDGWRYIRWELGFWGCSECKDQGMIDTHTGACNVCLDEGGNATGFQMTEDFHCTKCKEIVPGQGGLDALKVKRAYVAKSLQCMPTDSRLLGQLQRLDAVINTLIENPDQCSNPGCGNKGEGWKTCYVLCEHPGCNDGLDRRRMLQRQSRDSPVMQELLRQTGHPDRRRLPARKFL